MTIGYVWNVNAVVSPLTTELINFLLQSLHYSLLVYKVKGTLLWVYKEKGTL